MEVLGRLVPFREHLGPSWEPPGVAMGRSGHVLGASSSRFGPSCESLGAILGRLGCLLELPGDKE